jgi:hypothetical protein
MLWEWHQVTPSKACFWCKYTLNILLGQMWSDYAPCHAQTNMNSKFHSHNDVEQAWTKIRLAMGANVRMLTLIKSHHSWGGIFNEVALSMSANGLQPLTKSTKLSKFAHMMLHWPTFWYTFDSLFCIDIIMDPIVSKKIMVDNCPNVMEVSLYHLPSTLELTFDTTCQFWW